MVLLLMGTAAEAQGIFDGLMDRAKDSAERKARDRVNQRIDQTIDKGMNQTEEEVQCVATDQDCLKRAKEQGKQVSFVNTPAASDSVKCVVTDTGCLRQAKTQGKKVEIIDEAELDTLSCSVSDGDCLKRAKSLGRRSRSSIDLAYFCVKRQIGVVLLNISLRLAERLSIYPSLEPADQGSRLGLARS